MVSFLLLHLLFQAFLYCRPGGLRILDSFCLLILILILSFDSFFSIDSFLLLRS